jgi:hypothetical protein
MHGLADFGAPSLHGTLVVSNPAGAPTWSIVDFYKGSV